MDEIFETFLSVEFCPANSFSTNPFRIDRVGPAFYFG